MTPTETEHSHSTEKIIPRVIEEEMKAAYINYAMSVIVGRALPNIRDGLKPVHRRILYSMYKMGLLHNKPFKKCAKIVGDCLGSFHPHGDASVYDALVRMAQDFSLRYPLIKGQGNFGSMDGDNAAAYRYTEAKLTKLAEEMLHDIEKDTVAFKDNFDGSVQEPVILPSKIPGLLINGSSGIAVGMATNIPPHNLNEICDGIIALIHNQDITVQELMEIIPAPDFPTGGEVSAGPNLLHAYTHGKGKVTIKAITVIEEKRIIITEMPYQVNKSDMIKHIAELVKDKRIPGIRNINDESDREGVRVVIDIKKDVDPNVVLNQLYQYSRMKISFGIQMLSLVDNQPVTIGLKPILQHHIDHRQEVIVRRTKYDLIQAEKRIHILEGLLIALNDIDPIVRGIKQSHTVEDAKQFLIGTYQLTEVQAKAILEMRLQKLASLEQEKIKKEHTELLEKIAYLKSILESEEKILGLIVEELTELKEKFGDARRSKVVQGEDEFVDIEELIEEKTVVVTLSHAGYIKRIPLDTYKTQRRGGKGVKAAGTREEDFVEKLYVTSTHDYLLVLTDKGQLYWIKVWQLPEGSRQAKGKHIRNVLELKAEENINAIIPVRSFEEGYLFMATRKGVVKKTELNAFSNVRKGGIRALTLDEMDELVRVRYTDGNNEILLATKFGSANRFNESTVRAMGRTARGVRGIRLRTDDEVIGMLAADEGKDILTITVKGYGKRTPVSEYRLCNRGGKGVTNIKVTEKNGEVSSVMLVDGTEELMLVSRNGIGIRIPCSSVSKIGRATQGVRVMRLNEGDTVAASAKIAVEEVEDENGDMGVEEEIKEPVVEETESSAENDGSVAEETEKSLNEENDLEETETSVDNEENNSAE